jgi:hypothetical protein
VVPVFVTAAVIVIASVALKPLTRSGPGGEQDLPVQQVAKHASSVSAAGEY